MRIDVIIPCYNYGHYLRGCVESVLRQTDVEVKVLIIDDCSPDSTPEVGQELAAENTSVEYRRHEQNQGHIATYNEGFAWCSGDAVLLLSADDLLTPGSLERAARVLIDIPAVGLVWGSQIVFDEVVPQLEASEKWSHWIRSGEDLIEEMCRTGSNPVMTPTAVVRTAVMKAIGGYESQLPHTADMHCWLRCAARGSVAVIDVPQAFKRMHGQNMQVEFVTHRIRDLQQKWRAVELFMERDSQLVPRGAEFSNLAHRSIAMQAFWAASEAFDRDATDRMGELLSFASELDTSLPFQACWSRLAWKRRLGLRVWRSLSPLSNMLRNGGRT